MATTPQKLVKPFSELPPPLEEIEALIRSGQAAQAKEQLLRLNANHYPRGAKWVLANFYWRLGSPDIAAKLLHRYVRSKDDFKASAPEKAEYAAALMRNGASVEALHLLETVGSDYPKAALYRFFVLASQWRYEEALEVIKPLTTNEAVDEYTRSIAMVNAISALVFLRRHAEATSHLESLLPTAKKNGFLLLHANLIELKVGNFVLQKKLAEARALLSQADGVLKDSPMVDSLFIDKWRAAIPLLQEGDTDALERLKSRALGRNHYETVRHCDALRACYLQDKELLLRLYFGTPYPEFRKMLLHDFGGTVEIPIDYLRSYENGGGDIFDLNGPELTKLPTVPRKIFIALVSDFYRPASVAWLHEKAFEAKYFNPLSSPHRVHEAVHRLRKCLEDEKLPFTIHFSNRAYTLKATHPIRIKITLEAQDAVPELVAAKQLFGQNTFSRKDFASALKLADRTAARLIKAAVDDNTLEVSGSGAKTRYRFLQNR